MQEESARLRDVRALEWSRCRSSATLPTPVLPLTSDQVDEDGGASAGSQKGKAEVHGNRSRGFCRLDRMPRSEEADSGDHDDQPASQSCQDTQISAGQALDHLKPRDGKTHREKYQARPNPGKKSADVRKVVANSRALAAFWANTNGSRGR